MTAIDWPGLLRLGLRLGLAPEAFWRLSLKEWRSLTAVAAPSVPSRRELDRLMAEHPDAGEAR